MMEKAMRPLAVILCIVVLLSLSACANSTNTADTAKTPAETPATADQSKPGDGNRVYFAGPLFNESEKNYNLLVTKVLEDAGYDVFLPQRDGIEAAQLEGKSEEELIDMIFSLDESEVNKADIIFMNLDGRVPDEGACVELGIAYANGKRCYGFKTDTRSVELGMDLNPMISGCMTKLFKNYDGEKMIEELKDYLSDHKL